MRRLSKLPILALVLAASLAQAQSARHAAAIESLARESNEENLEETVTDYDGAARGIWPSRIRVGFGFLRGIDAAAITEFEKAWQVSRGGASGREGVVLMFRGEDGSYKGKSQNYTNEYRRVTFKWNPAAVAIVHTHPNDTDPKPSAQDQRVAQKYDVPIFTITMRGMYAYDPATRITGKVLDGLDWLSPSKWTQDVYRKLSARFAGENTHRPPPYRTITEVTRKRSADESTFKQRASNR